MGQIYAPYDLTLVGNAIYALQYANEASLLRIDANDWSILSRVGPLQLWPNGFVLSGNLGFGTYSGVGRILDLSDPLQPVVKAELTTPKHINRMAVNSSWLYVSYGNNTTSCALQIFDVSDPANPVPRGTAPLGFVSDIAATQNCAFVCGSLSGFTRKLFLFDVRNADAPSLVKEYPLVGQSNKIRIVGRQAFIKCFGATSSFLHMLDLRDPFNPVLLKTVTLPGFPNSLTVEENRVFVSGGESGLQIFEYPEADKPAAVKDWMMYEFKDLSSHWK